MNISNPHPSIVDRSISVTLPPHLSQTTPSTESKRITPKVELLHRLHGTALLSHATFLLFKHHPSSVSIYATSTTLFHRFYHRKSLSEYNVWGTAMACTVLACKIEEQVKRLREVVLVYVHLYRRFRLGLFSSSNYCNEPSTHEHTTTATSMFQTAQSSVLRIEQPTDEEKQNILRYIRPMVETSALYRAWEDELVKMEHILLRELGFSLFWMPESHPHVFLLYFLKVLEIVDTSANTNSTDGSNNSNSVKNGADVEQIAWNYCNDSCRLDICVRYPPEVTACAAIYLACIEQNIHLPQTPRPWWHVFIGPDQDDNLSNTCNGILALGVEGEGDNACLEFYRDAMRKFVVSLVPGSKGNVGGSFNDPGTMIWKAFEEHE